MVASSAEFYGADRMLLASVVALRARGDAVDVILPADGPLRAAIDGTGARTTVLPDYAVRRRFLGLRELPFALGRALAAFVRLRRLHRAVGYDLVYTNTLAVPVGPVLAGLCGVPHIWHVHENVDGRSLEGKVMGLLVRQIGGVIVAASASIEAGLRSAQPNVSVFVVHNGVELTDLATVRPPAMAEPVRIGLVARIHPWKGHHLLLDALEVLASKFSFSATVFGDALEEHAELASQLRSRVNANLPGRVRFESFDRDRSQVYAALDIVVVASTSPEPFSLVAVEAGLAGRPVVAPDEGGPTEIIVPELTGLLFPARSVQGLATALERLLLDKQLALSLGETARATYPSRFSIEAYQQTIAEACSSAAKP